LRLLDPWIPVGPHAHPLERALASEIGADHPLAGRAMRAIARREDCDDVLFVSADDAGLVAVVHLTCAQRPETDPRWPETTFFRSLDDWVERGMKPDHLDRGG